jgi:hypothetical protein
MRKSEEYTNKYEEWVEEEEDNDTINRNSKTIEHLIENLIERDSIEKNAAADKKLDVQFYSIILPIFFYFFVST